MKEVFFRKLQRLKEESLYLGTNRARFLKGLRTSIDTRKTVERSVYLCAEISLDLAEMAISIKSLPKPSTYSDTIYKLGDYKIIPRTFAKKFVYIAGLRNFLAHDYQIDATADLERFLNIGLNDVKKFICLMEKL